MKKLFVCILLITTVLFALSSCAANNASLSAAIPSEGSAAIPSAPDVSPDVTSLPIEDNSTAVVSDQSGEKNLKAFEFAVDSDAAESGRHAEEYPLWSLANTSEHYDKNAPASATVTVNGKTYTGNYDYSCMYVPSTTAVHSYKGDGFRFLINAQTGVMTAFYNYEAGKTSAALTENESAAAAENIIAQYLDTSDTEYKRLSDIVDLTQNYLCRIIMYREIDGFSSADYISVVVDGNGVLFSIEMPQFGSFDGVQTIGFDYDEANRLIDGKIGQIYADDPEYKDYSVANVTPVVLDEGSYGIVYEINVSTEREYFDEELSTELTAESGCVVNLIVALSDE